MLVYSIFQYVPYEEGKKLLLHQQICTMSAVGNPY